MWTRKDLKTRAKSVFKMNYWKAVLAALILSIVVGGGGSSFSGSSSAISSSLVRGSISSTSYMHDDHYIYDIEDDSYHYIYDVEDIEDLPEGSIPQIIDTSDPYSDYRLSPLMGLVLAGMMTVVILIIAAIMIALDILLLNPLEVGIRRFFTRNLYEKAQVRELAFGFDHSYKNVLKVMFFRDLHTFLWSLLFIIPGIIKTYEYRMIPYLLAEYPDMPKEDAFAISKYMMSGNKWKAFVLDLSFILWILGSVFTLGLLGLFYGDPYIAQTGAALYDALKLEKQPFAPQQIPNTQPQTFTTGQPFAAQPQNYTEAQSFTAQSQDFTEAQSFAAQHQDFTEGQPFAAQPQDFTESQSFAAQPQGSAATSPATDPVSASQDPETAGETADQSSRSDEQSAGLQAPAEQDYNKEQ